MTAQIGRDFAYHEGTNDQIALTTSSSTTPEIPFEQFAGGMIFIPSGSPITTLTYYATPRSSASPQQKTPETNFSTNPAATLYQLFNAGGAVTQTVAAGNCYPLPPECYAAGSLYITVNSAGSVEICKKG